MNEAASISVLPEGCLSDVLSLTSPRDACRAALISKGFNSAADSDAVWEQFLPPDYREVIARALSPLVFGSKKKLYLFLSDSHILVDHDYLSFHLDKESGKKCYMLEAKKLSIAWQDDTRYWEWAHIPESRWRMHKRWAEVAAPNPIKVADAEEVGGGGSSESNKGGGDDFRNPSSDESEDDFSIYEGGFRNPSSDVGDDDFLINKVDFRNHSSDVDASDFTIDRCDFENPSFDEG